MGEFSKLTPEQKQHRAGKLQASLRIARRSAPGNRAEVSGTARRKEEANSQTGPPRRRPRPRPPRTRRPTPTSAPPARPPPNPRRSEVTRSPATVRRAESAPRPTAPASLRLRLAAMIYEAVLFLASCSLSVLLVLMTSIGISALRTCAACCKSALFFAIGAYFGWCWTRTGQTLALKTWSLRTSSTPGSHPSLTRADCALRPGVYAGSCPGWPTSLAHPLASAGVAVRVALGFVASC